MLSEAQKRANQKWRAKNKNKVIAYNVKSGIKKYAKKLGVSYEERLETHILKCIRYLYI